MSKPNQVSALVRRRDRHSISDSTSALAANSTSGLLVAYFLGPVLGSRAALDLGEFSVFPGLLSKLA